MGTRTAVVGTAPEHLDAMKRHPKSGVRYQEVATVHLRVGVAFALHFRGECLAFFKLLPEVFPDFGRFEI